MRQAYAGGQTLKLAKPTLHAFNPPFQDLFDRAEHAQRARDAMESEFGAILTQ